MNKVKIGWSEVDFTPTQKIRLAGQFFERISNEVESPIGATAIAVDNGSDYVIMCSCDLVGVQDNLNRRVKEKIKKESDINPDKVVLSAIHTHTSYVYDKEENLDATSASSFEYLKKIIPEDMEYKPLVSSETAMDDHDALLFLVDKITNAVISAWNNRAPAYYRNAFGRAVVGMNRRVCYDDGSAKMWGDTNLANFECLEAGNDSGIELIYTYDADKKLTGVIANIACPAQVVEHRSFISSDYWGKVKENLRKVYGNDFKVLGLCSAAGDQCPRDMIRWVNPETPIDDPNIKRNDYIERRADPSMFDVSGLKIVGRRISNEILLVHEELNSEYKDSADLIHHSINMPLPLRRVTIKEYNDAVEKINNFIDKNRGKRINFDDNASLHIYSGTIARYLRQQKTNIYTIETHIIKFGDVAISTNPFELFLDYGNKIRARSRAKQTFLIQLAGGSGGYLPTKHAEEGSHYSAYVSSGNVGHVGGDIFVRETLEIINKMF